jgi:beta-glucosidase-like glycosyl hydrolase/CubicO group peptidase (beta-lactamase class C family)
MVAAYSNKNEAEYATLEAQIKNYHLGGVIFFQGDPATQIKLTNRYQQAAKYPLMVGIDAEWGLGMRLDSTISYPRQLTLGAIQDDALIFKMGEEIGRQHARMGIHVNFAPVVDVNNNAKNPVINDRSFGENRENVSKKGIAYMKGLQNVNVLACAKHFPGHGDTDVDSHYDLPMITHNRARLDSIELYPFKQMIEAGVSSMMIAHLNIPALDATPNSPSTLSKKIVQDLLQKEMGFNGLIFTDALQMKGITKNLTVGQSSVKSFMAGNDVLLFPDNIQAAITQMKTAYSKGQIKEADINKSVKRILLAKSWAGLEQFQPIKEDSVVYDLNREASQLLKFQLIEAAITVVRDSANLIPLKDIAQKKIASVTIGKSEATPFTKMLDNYTTVTHYFLPNTDDWTVYEKMLKTLAEYDVVLANTQSMSRFAGKNFFITANAAKFAKALSTKKNAILTVFGSPYSLEKFPGWKELIVGYEESVEAQEITAQIIFGGRSAKGKLPVSAVEYQFGEGITTAPPDRLRYGNINELGYETKDLAQLDSIIKATIAINATPGCQVLVAKNGLVFYNQSFGKHTYETNGKVVKNSDLYDIASITKIAATTALVMRLVDEGKLDINKTLGDYLDLPDTTNKEGLVIKDILAHQAGLIPFIPFYTETLDSNKTPDKQIYQIEKSDDFPIMVCDDLYCSIVYQDSIWHTIHYSRLLDNKSYKYSDLGFYYMMLLVESIYQKPIAQLAEEYFFQPLGMDKTTYNPLSNGFNLNEIVPTETEKVFRGRTIHGYVHDPGAAMIGGVAGHAGVFSNANDLAKYMQMFLNDGHYGGQQYLDSATVQLFTSAPFEESRRGLGFDKPDPSGRYGSAATSASLNSFGHTGFTGTVAFADPDNDLVFIFLSNRIHPTADNKKLIQENSRSIMHQAMYDLFAKPKSILNF